MHKKIFKYKNNISSIQNNIDKYVNYCDRDKTSIPQYITNKKKIGLIITGQLRNFHLKQSYNELINNINLWNNYYDIYIIYVINDIYEESFFDNINKLIFKHYYINYMENYKEEYDDYVKILLNNDIYINKKYEFDLNYDIDKSIQRTMYQFHQLQVGIQKIKQIETNENIIFDVIMRTRFDIKYPSNFIPFIPDEPNFIKKINFPNINILYNVLYAKKINIDNLIYYIKHQHQNQNMTYLMNDMDQIISFGSRFMYNYISLENIYNNLNCKNILYSYNDFFYFAERNTFLKLEKLVNVLGKQEYYYNIHNYFATETQLIIYCLNNDINILMYFYHTNNIIR
jgi:hypothetical protein